MFLLIIFHACRNNDSEARRRSGRVHGISTSMHTHATTQTNIQTRPHIFSSANLVETACRSQTWMQPHQLDLPPPEHAPNKIVSIDPAHPVKFEVKWMPKEHSSSIPWMPINAWLVLQTRLFTSSPGAGCDVVLAHLDSCSSSRSASRTTSLFANSWATRRSAQNHIRERLFKRFVDKFLHSSLSL